MKTTTDGFTGDVVALILCGDKSERLNLLRQVDDEPISEFLKRGVILSLSPIMQSVPPFVAQVVGLALMEHVDWDEVALWAMTDPEAN